MAKLASKPLPKIVKTEHGFQLIVDGRPMILLAGELQNSSASSMKHMEECGGWARMVSYNCNTVLAPVYWELIEPQEGRFDFSSVTELIQSARKHGLRLVVLWFGTWKNATSTYVPEWVKTDLERFTRCETAPGRRSRTISPFCQAAREADGRAFGKLMAHIRDIDAARQTVLMVQVENETGLLNADRDYSPAAQAAFAQPVPPALLTALAAAGDALHPDLAACTQAPKGGDWTSAFGRHAPEAFMAWHLASYVQQVVQAGKKAYALPMFVNAWLDYGCTPGGFPSGGPVAKMLDIWRTAAPAIDAFAPDIYMSDFKRPVADFSRPFNPLIIPESHVEPAGRQAFWALGAGAICFAPFGVDEPHCFVDQPWEAHGLGAAYALLGEMMPVIAEAQAAGRIRGILQLGDGQDQFHLGDYELTVKYYQKLGGAKPPAAGLVIQLADDDFCIVGRGFSVTFAPAASIGGIADFLTAEEGHFAGGKWMPGRRLNGDDTFDATLRLQDTLDLQTRRGKLYRFA